MARKPSSLLTDAELRIMRVLWDRGPSTTMDVVEAIASPPLARNTVMTVLGVLERKGYVKHRTEGRTYVYRAVVPEDDVRGKAIENVVKRFFNGSAKELVVKLLDERGLSSSERKRIQELFEKGGER